MTSLRARIQKLEMDLAKARVTAGQDYLRLEAKVEHLGNTFEDMVAVKEADVCESVVEPEPAQKLTREQAEAFMEETDLPSLHPLVPAGKATVFEQKKCQHCNGVHDRKCPAVQEIEYHTDGKVKRVVYFPHGMWPTDGVIWLEDIMAALDTGEEVTDDGDSEG